ncbi:uncharacterized protein UV8b_01432 [Ustilaginoidea virens]|uniref:Exonuclease domain-containing protein n=1 Tax=Ustilaginoidea virens TaxID=1159556 RepID=A0A8E5MEC3_USTVR|nr:uncharacterized protein UV8b_01432 [Ustilaginoidea virens]QUC17191.1 hypothetical protein UV8b_01432 [Ustilaginoidea virens]
MRCERCSKVLKRDRRNRPLKPKLPLTQTAGRATSSQDDDPVLSGSGLRKLNIHGHSCEAASEPGDSEPRQPAGKLACRFHPGRVANKTWTCCRRPPLSKPCSGNTQHTPRQYPNGHLERNWRFYETPSERHASHVAAVALDCEMGVASSGDSELIRVSVLDFFTGAVLLDKLVYPSVRMAHYNTRFSGVTWQAMEEACRRRNCLFGRDAARQAVCELVGPDTVVVCHAGHGDLVSLRWIHRRTVDTLVIETRRREIELACSKVRQDSEPAASLPHEVGQGAVKAPDAAEREPAARQDGLSLKALALQRLKRAIQVSGRGHDSVQDALATRDLVQWYIANPASS